jgi:hypothetical protein
MLEMILHNFLNVQVYIANKKIITKKSEPIHFLLAGHVSSFASNTSIRHRNITPSVIKVGA